MFQALLSDFASGFAGKRGDACSRYARDLEKEMGTVVKVEEQQGWDEGAIAMLMSAQARAGRGGK